MMNDNEKLDAMRMNDSPADKWVAANDAVDEAALAIEIADGLVLSNTQRRAMLTATFRAISRSKPDQCASSFSPDGYPLNDETNAAFNATMDLHRALRIAREHLALHCNGNCGFASSELRRSDDNV